MVFWSLIFGVLGILGTFLLVLLFENFPLPRGLRWSWFLGVAGFFPSWLLLFLHLLKIPAGSSDITPLPPAAILSSGAALLGIIFTEAAVRKFHWPEGSGPSRIGAWLLGLIALIPAWLIAYLRG